MAFDVLQASRDAGMPIELYDFVFPGRQVLLTNHARAVEFQGVEYAPATITRSRFVLQPDTDRQDITFTAPFDGEPAASILDLDDMMAVRVTVHLMHFGDTERKTLFTAKLVSFSVNFAAGTAAMVFRTNKQDLSKETLARRFRTRFCPYYIYDNDCGVQAANFRKTVTLVAVDGDRLTLPLGWAAPLVPADYAFGAFGWSFMPGAPPMSAWILEADDNGIRIDRPFRTMAAGDDVFLYPGCDKTAETCQNRFNNISRYGGMLGRPPLPGGSPFVSER